MLRYLQRYGRAAHVNTAAGIFPYACGDGVPAEMGVEGESPGPVPPMIHVWVRAAASPSPFTAALLGAEGLLNASPCTKS